MARHVHQHIQYVPTYIFALQRLLLVAHLYFGGEKKIEILLYV